MNNLWVNIFQKYEWISEKCFPLLEACSLLLLRLLIAWEFLESGLEKWRGQNWFSDILQQFPFPLNMLSADLNWTMATYAELIGAGFLFLGFLTRFSAISLFMVTIVAIISVHWPEKWDTFADLWKGYAIENEGHGNFKLPLIYLVMLFVLIAKGAGKISIDRLLFYYAKCFVKNNVAYAKNKDNVRPFKPIRK